MLPCVASTAAITSVRAAWAPARSIASRSTVTSYGARPSSRTSPAALRVSETPSTVSTSSILRRNDEPVCDARYIAHVATIASVVVRHGSLAHRLLALVPASTGAETRAEGLPPSLGGRVSGGHGSARRAPLARIHAAFIGRWFFESPSSSRYVRIPPWCPAH